MQIKKQHSDFVKYLKTVIEEINNQIDNQDSKFEYLINLDKIEEAKSHLIVI